MARKIDLIVIHSADTPNGRPQTVMDIDGWHRQRDFKRKPAARKVFNPGLTSIGYHYVIYVDGTVHPGRALDEIGAHAAGYNAHSVGICLIGKDKFTPAQWRALDDLLVSLLAKIGGTVAVCGHRDLSPDKDGDGKVEPSEWMKTCPGFDVGQWQRAGHVPLIDHVLPG